jgi:hypothetical protein
MFDSSSGDLKKGGDFMGTFTNVPASKRNLLSDEDKANLVDYRNPENSKDADPKYNDVITREDSTVVEKPAQRSRKS